MAASPFADYRARRGVVWLERAVEVEVGYTGRLDGVLREPVFRGSAVWR